MPLFDYDPPERFVTGTVGEPGQRTFFLQARGGGRVTSVALEKQQVAVLAERVEELLDEVVRRSGGTAPVPAMAPADQIDNDAAGRPDRGGLPGRLDEPDLGRRARGRASSSAARSPSRTTTRTTTRTTATLPEPPTRCP